MNPQMVYYKKNSPGALPLPCSKLAVVTGGPDTPTILTKGSEVATATCRSLEADLFVLLGSSH